MTRNVQKTLGVRLALVAAVAFPLIIATSLRAQEPAASPAAPTTGTNIAPSGAAPAGEATTERVVVTGSNIPTAEEVGPNPVDTYRRDDLTRLGVRTPTDFILRIPSASGFQQTENITNGGAGVTFVDLRGIDPKETLVLQDNRRLAYFGTASVDFNRFPLGLIDHIDILKDGASPVYGTEAVDGVVNVFLIHRFRGLEVYASYGNTNLGFANDRDEETGYLLAGTGDDKTNIVVYAGMYNSGAIYSRDVDVSHDANFSSFGGVDVRSGNFAGRVQSRVFLGNATASSGFKLFLKTPTPHASANQVTDTQYTSRFNAAIPSERSLFNFADLTPLVAATDREYLYGSFDRDICDKYLTVFADFEYFRQFWNGGFAPTPFVPDVWADINHPFGIAAAGMSVPTQNAFNPFTVADYTSPGGVNSAGGPFVIASAAPPGTAFTTGVRYRSLEAGLRVNKIYTNNYLFTGGLRGNLGEFANAWDQLKTWEWEAGFRYNDAFEVSKSPGFVNNNALRSALLDTNPATAFDMFGKNVNNKGVLQRVFATLSDQTDNVLMTEDLVLRGDMFNLPGGAVRFAIGGQHLGNTIYDTPDPLTSTGQTTGSTNFQPTKGNRDAWSVYEEVKVPVTGPTWNFPGAYSLELGYAEREEWYSDFGDTQRPKFDVRWQPIDQSLTLRAAYIEAFHAPTLGELFSGASQSFPTVHDTCPTSICNTEAQIQQTILGNRKLLPEVAYEYTYGGVLTPGKWWAPLQGLTLSADFVHIDLRGFTSVLDPNFLIANAGPSGCIGPACFQREGGNGTATPIINATTPLQNLGGLKLSAWDFEAVEIFDTSRLGHGDWGTFTATWNATYNADIDIQFLPGAEFHTVVGKFGGGFQGASGGGNYTHNRWYASLFYDGPNGSWMQGIDAGAVVHFVGQYWDTYGFHVCADGTVCDRKIREFTTMDLIVNYTFNLPPPAAQSEVAGYAKDGGKNVKMKDGKEKNVMPVSTAEYNPCGWRAWLNNTTLTLGVNNVWDELPPFVASSFENGMDEQTSNAKGRLWYVGIKKRF